MAVALAGSYSGHIRPCRGSNCGSSILFLYLKFHGREAWGISPGLAQMSGIRIRNISLLLHFLQQATDTEEMAVRTPIQKMPVWKFT